MIEIARYRSRLTDVEVDAVQIDPLGLDYEGMCEIVGWCGGRMIGQEDRLPWWPRDAVISIAGMYACLGDWVAYRADQERFYPIMAHVMERFDRVEQEVAHADPAS